MIYSQNLNQAIEFATKVHHVDQDQKRKGKGTPYIAHLLSVMYILSKVTDDEDILIAGVLHDVIEDCYPPGSVTLKDVKEKFGSKVARLVDAITEKGEWQNLAWRERKQKAMKKIKDMDHDDLLLKSADVLHNLSCSIYDWQKEGDALFNRFNSTKADQLWRYTTLIQKLENAWPQNPLLPELKNHVTFIEKNW